MSNKLTQKSRQVFLVPFDQQPDRLVFQQGGQTVVIVQAPDTQEKANQLTKQALDWENRGGTLPSPREFVFVG